jgi:predicted amidohydrolase YtcJ
MTEERELPRLMELTDGRVIIIGGGSELRSTASRTTEIFDPSKEPLKNPLESVQFLN